MTKASIRELWQVKTKIVVPPETYQAILFLKNQNPQQSFFSSFLEKLIFYQDVMLREAKTRMSVAF